MQAYNARRGLQPATADEWDGYQIPEYKTRRQKKPLSAELGIDMTYLVYLLAAVILCGLFLWTFSGDSQRGSLEPDADALDVSHEYYFQHATKPQYIGADSKDAVYLYRHQGGQPAVKTENKDGLMTFKYDVSELQTFSCANGDTYQAKEQFNDDFCDCDDGSDEPNTNACGSKTQKFECHDKKSSIWSSQVGDGLCDCCDGSDEPVDVLLTCKRPKSCD